MQASGSEPAIVFMDWIASVADVATTIAALVGAVTLLLAWRQIKLARRQMQANMTYTILKDGRELFMAMEALPDDKKNYGPVFNLYASAFELWRLKMLSDDFWKTIESEIEFFVTMPEFLSFWTAERKAMFSSDFVAFIEKFLRN